VLATFCRVSLTPDSCVRQSEGFFERWGPSSLIFAKFIPGLSTVAPPLAGALRLKTSPFLLYSSLAAFGWVAAPIAGGALFHNEID
jgi:membrane protein DedA with SNARE-associated domain